MVAAVARGNRCGGGGDCCCCSSSSDRTPAGHREARARVYTGTTTDQRSEIREIRSSGPVCATRPQTADQHAGRVKRTGRMAAILPRIRVIGGTRDITVGVGETRRENVVVVTAAATTAAVHTPTRIRAHTSVGKKKTNIITEKSAWRDQRHRDDGVVRKKRARVRSMRCYYCVTLYTSSSSSSSSSARRTRHV